MPSTKKNLSVSQLRVGLFVLAGLVILAFMILNSSGDFNPFKKTMTLKARFASADGLREGAEVQLAGIRIGKVSLVRLLPPDSPEDAKVEATIIVDRELEGRPVTERIRTDSLAQLVATSVLANDKMINITTGTAKGSPVNEGHVLDSRDAISINQLTVTGNELLQQINRLAGPANEILNKANQGEGTLGNFINDPSLYNSLDTTILETKTLMVKLQETVEGLNKGGGSAGKLLKETELYDSLNATVKQLEAISADIRAGRGSAGKFISDEKFYEETKQAVTEIRGAAEKLNGVADDLKVLTGNMRLGKGSAGKLFTDEKLYENAVLALDRFNSTAEKLDLILGDARGGKGTLGKLLTDETLYNNVNQTASNVNQLSSEGTKLLYDFRQNPKKYLRIKVSLF
jgi:phospholipid/cholesterol/gamma-HCH transport system substrate-binding protein